MSDTALLLISCPDRKGLVARVSDFIFRHEGNIINFDQHTDLDAGVFLARVEWELMGFAISREEIAQAFAPVAAEYDRQFQVHFGDTVPRIAILASKMRHCRFLPCRTPEA